MKDIDIEYFLSYVEQLVGKVQDNRRNLVRAKVASVITNHIHRFRDVKCAETKLFNEAKRFLRENDELLVVKSDKGGVTVILDKLTYDAKIREQIDDTQKFKKLSRDPTLTIQNKSNKIIANLVKSKLMTEEEGKVRKIYNSIAPRVYGNPKVHNVSGIQGPTNHVAKYMASILKKAYNTENEYYIADSFQFSRLINNFKMPENDVLVSLDVINLFGNMSKSIIVKAINSKWDTIKTFASGLTERKFVEIVEFILDSNYFTYNDQFYLQTFGCAMGSNLSPILAQYVMDYLLDECLKQIPFKPTFIKKYVDDLIVALPRDKVEVLFNAVNSFYENIKFTVEHEVNRSVPFLDTKVIRDVDNIVKLDWYRKPNSSGRYIHFYSNHNINIKINFIREMKGRIHNICHKDFVEKNLIILENLLIENGYPKQLIRRINYNKAELHKRNEPPDIQKNEVNYGVLPFYDLMTDKLVKIFVDENIIVAKKSVKSVGSLFSNLKNKIPKLLTSNVVYKLICSTCHLVYVGQTSQWLKSRMAIHKSDIRKGIERCALAGHVKYNPNHVIDFGNVEIMAKERNYERRLFLEMANINRFRNSINKKTDTQNLNVIYTYLLDNSFNNVFDGPLDE